MPQHYVSMPQSRRSAVNEPALLPNPPQEPTAPGEPERLREPMTPLLPILLPLVVTALILGVAFAYFFPVANTRPAPVARFTDIAEKAGLRLPPTGAGPDSPTTLGGAVVVFDYDNDGRPDLFFVNGGPWPWEEQLAKEPGQGSCTLFHNDGNGHFTDVTARAGLNVPLQGMAAAAGDFDNDGLVDLFVTCVGTNHLFRNRGDGRFEDVTEQAGVGGDPDTWSTGAAWIDVDGDGRLDLVVAHYARWSSEVGLGLAFTVAKVGRSYGTPTGFVTAYPSVYRNLGDGRFALMPGSAGLRDVDPQTRLPVGKPLAVVPVDANGDGRLDLLFSYHTAESALFLNQGDGTFRKWEPSPERKEGASAGAVSGGALPLRIAVGDERLQAFEAARALAARQPEDGSVHLLGKLGVAPLDYELDGNFEFFTGDGRLEPDINRFEEQRTMPASPQLYWNDGGTWKRTQVVAGADAQSAWTRPIVARGVAVADFDGDGDLDVVITQYQGQPLLLRNDQRLGMPWLRVKLVATRTAEEAGGARVEVHTPRGVLAQTVAPAMGFMSQSESTLTFGLGEDARVQEIFIRWPSGQRQEIRPVSVNQTLVIHEP